MPIRRDQLANLLKDRAFREQFVSDQPGEFLPMQIKRLRERRGWTQAELGEKADMQQVAISRWENPDYKGITINTLKRLARAFDVALIVRLAPFSEFVDWFCTLSPRSFLPASFEEESSIWQHGATQGVTGQVTLPWEVPNQYGTAANIVPFYDPGVRKELSEGMEIAMTEGATRNAAS